MNKFWLSNRPALPVDPLVMLLGCDPVASGSFGEIDHSNRIWSMRMCTAKRYLKTNRSCTSRYSWAMALRKLTSSKGCLQWRGSDEEPALKPEKHKTTNTDTKSWFPRDTFKLSGLEWNKSFSYRTPQIKIARLKFNNGSAQKKRLRKIGQISLPPNTNGTTPLSAQPRPH